MDPGWFLLFLFLLVEIFLITLLCLPMPSNSVRGAITGWVASLWDSQPVQYLVYFLLAVDVIYFCFVFQALLHPLYDFFPVFSPIEMGISCEQKQDLFYNERNAYITGGSIFLFFILNRLVDIQDKLHKSRHHIKSLSATTTTTDKGDNAVAATAPVEVTIKVPPQAEVEMVESKKVK